jgi:hypothetical protein
MPPVPPLLMALVGAFFSRPLYRAVARQWSTATALRYLFVLIALSWVVGVLKLHHDLDAFAADEGRALIAQVPPMRVKDGTLSTPEARPYVVTGRGGGDARAVIDTTGGTETLDQVRADVLITRDRILVRRSGVGPRVFAVRDLVDAGGLEGRTVGPVELASWLDGAARWIPIVVFPFAVGASYLYRITTVLVLAMIGTGIGRLRGLQLPYAMSFRLACVAITPLIVVDTILGLWDDAVPSVVDLAIACGYLYLGIDANVGADPDAPRVRPSDLAAR